MNQKDRSSFTEIVKKFEKKLGFKAELKWRTVMSIGVYHIIGFYWIYLYAFPVKWQSVVFAGIMFVIGGIGITCGVHRLWTHRTYKATVPLQFFLMISFTSAGQNSIYDWVRDHRLHHKYSDTEADPHNVNRGFIFSHIGWLMMKKNEQVLTKGRQIDMSDIENDKLLMWERKHSLKLRLLFCYFLPTITGIILWGETWTCAVAWQCFIRILCVLHCEMTVNSLAHMYGYKPYNKKIIPCQNIFVSTCTFGEGWHNYHHVFPYDYKAAETFDLLNWSTAFIRLWAKIGIAYDLKEPSKELIASVVSRLNNENLNDNSEAKSDKYDNVNVKKEY